MAEDPESDDLGLPYDEDGVSDPFEDVPPAGEGEDADGDGAGADGPQSADGDGTQSDEESGAGSDQTADGSSETHAGTDEQSGSGDADHGADDDADDGSALSYDEAASTSEPPADEAASTSEPGEDTGESTDDADSAETFTDTESARTDYESSDDAGDAWTWDTDTSDEADDEASAADGDDASAADSDDGQWVSADPNPDDWDESEATEEPAASGGDDEFDQPVRPNYDVADESFDTEHVPRPDRGQPTPAGGGGGGPGHGVPATPGGHGDPPLGGDAPGAPGDQEMPLADHIEEMVRRLAVVILVLCVVTAFVFPVSERLINFLWYNFLPGAYSQCPTTSNPQVACAYLYHPLALVFARIKVAALAGFVVSLPVLVYQSYLFMRPGLYPRERRYYLASVPMSLVLATIGVAFAFYLILPTLFSYFTGYTASAARIAYGLTETFNLIVTMMGFLALVFQIPLLVMLAIMMGVTSRRWLADKRIYFWGGFATVAFLFSPDPTGMAPIMVAATMIGLFEGTLLLLLWTDRDVPSVEAVAARRPYVWGLAALAGYGASSAPIPAGYYDQLPVAVVDALAGADLTLVTPVLIGGGLLAAFEAVAYLLRQARAIGRVPSEVRITSWLVAITVGYFASPDPVLVRRVDAIDLAPVEAGLVVAGLIVAFELAVFAARRRTA